MKATCGQVYRPSLHAFKVLNTPGAELIENWPFFAMLFKGVHKVIGICPVKGHSLCQASISIKNWFGLLGGTRNQFHKQIHNVISDMPMMTKPTLSIVDGTRILPVAVDVWKFEHCLDCGKAYPEYLEMASAKEGGSSRWEGRIKEVEVENTLS